MIFKNILTYSLYTAYSIYSRMAVYIYIYRGIYSELALGPKDRLIGFFQGRAFEPRSG